MSQTQYFYFPISVGELDLIVKAHQTEFDLLLQDTFTEEELVYAEKDLDAIAVMYVQPVLSELTFDDLYAKPSEEVKQRFFFENCRSSISLENLPYLQSNPYQVTYLMTFLERFSEVLIDKGGVSELVFKDEYMRELKSFKPMVKPIRVKVVKSKVIDPMDQLVHDVYKELDRLIGLDKLPEVRALVFDQSVKLSALFEALMPGRKDAHQLLSASGLIPKDFGDLLERLKFFLRKIS